MKRLTLLAVAASLLLTVPSLSAFAQGVIINGEADVTLSFTPPTLNTDGSTLDPADIDGYVLYWDTQSGDPRCGDRPVALLDPCYANALDLTDGTISSTATTISLTETTTVYFRMIVYNTDGAWSGYSNEASREFVLTVNAPPNPPQIESINISFTCTTDDPTVTCTFEVGNP